MPLSDLLWSAALGAELMGVFVLMVWISFSAWDAHKDKKRRKAAQKALREAKEAEARESAKDDKILGEVQAFYDGI